MHLYYLSYFVQSLEEDEPSRNALLVYDPRENITVGSMVLCSIPGITTEPADVDVRIRGIIEESAIPAYAWDQGDNN